MWHPFAQQLMVMAQDAWGNPQVVLPISLLTSSRTPSCVSKCRTFSTFLLSFCISHTFWPILTWLEENVANRHLEHVLSVPGTERLRIEISCQLTISAAIPAHNISYNIAISTHCRLENCDKQCAEHISAVFLYCCCWYGSTLPPLIGELGSSAATFCKTQMTEDKSRFSCGGS